MNTKEAERIMNHIHKETTAIKAAQAIKKLYPNIFNHVNNQ